LRPCWLREEVRAARFFLLPAKKFINTQVNIQVYIIGNLSKIQAKHTLRWFLRRALHRAARSLLRNLLRSSPSCWIFPHSNWTRIKLMPRRKPVTCVQCTGPDKFQRYIAPGRMNFNVLKKLQNNGISTKARVCFTFSQENARS
jgi:hypothetical protein